MPRIVVTTPEGKFDQVMERMESALAKSRPSVNSGVVTKQQCSYEVIPPAKADEPYRAEVTIETQVSLSKPHVRKLAPKTVGGVVANSDALSDERPLPNPSAAELVEASETATRETFELVFQDDRWKLITQPKGEREQICFNYALDQ